MSPSNWGSHVGCLFAELACSWPDGCLPVQTVATNACKTVLFETVLFAAACARLHGTHVRLRVHLPPAGLEEKNQPNPNRSPPARLQGYKAQLTQMGQWQAAMASLNPAVQQKLAAMCQL